MEFEVDPCPLRRSLVPDRGGVNSQLIAFAHAAMAKADLTPEQIAAKAQRKADKKAKKQALEDAQLDAAARDEHMATPANEDGAKVDETDKERRKREKKERKKRQREDEAGDGNDAKVNGGGEGAADGERKSKKSKKNKDQSAAVSADTPSTPSTPAPEPAAPVASTSTVPAPSAADVDAFLTENNISYEPASAKTDFPPVLSFASLPLADGVRKGLSGFAKPTPIQSASFPLMLAGRDVIGIAETGCVARALSSTPRTI